MMATCAVWPGVARAAASVEGAAGASEAGGEAGFWLQAAPATSIMARALGAISFEAAKRMAFLSFSAWGFQRRFFATTAPG